MGTVSLPYSSFNCGELSPLLEGRTDMAQYMKGGKIMLNLLPTVQGPAVRRGGTRLIGAGVGGMNPSVLIRFSRSQTESYVLEFGNGVLRFYFNGALVLTSGLVPYFITTPYTQADLFNDDGTPSIVASESADVIYLAHPNHPPQVLSFFAANNWTLAPLVFTDGPWQDINASLGLTVYASGGITVGSTVTLTANGAMFRAGMVGSLIRIHQQDLTTIKPWQPGQQNSVISVGTLRRSGFCTYRCANNSSGPPPSGGTSLLFVQTGGVTLVHTTGNAWDGDQSTVIDPLGASTYYSTGMEWTYQDCGYGVVQITAFTDSAHVTGTVMRQLPASVFNPATATNVWELGAWSNDQGWPSQVTFFRQRLTFAGGAANGNRTWMSVVQDYTNFADLDFGEVVPDGAVTLQCLSDQVNDIVYLSPADTLLVGTIGGEFIIGPQSISDPFGPENATVSQMSQYGGRAVVPTRVQQYTLFVTKNGRNMRESTFAFTAGPAGSYVSNDLTVLSEHITQGGIIATAWAKNPYTTIWMVLGNGKLISFIYNPEQEVRNWERHDLGSNATVVGLCVVPTGTGDWDDVYLMVARPDQFGIEQYSIERIEQPYANLPGDYQHDMFYVDCGLTLYNTVNVPLSYASAAVAGTTDAPFFCFTLGTFTLPSVGSNGDVGRYIDYDYEGTTIGDDGLPQPVGLRARAVITSVVNTESVLCTILQPWPISAPTTMPANSWRLSVSSITPITQWLGTTVSILADGACTPDVFVDGTVTSIALPFAASVVTAGIKSPAVFQSMKLEGGDRTGSAIGKIKRLIRATLRFFNTLGGRIGRDFDNTDPIKQRSSFLSDDTPPPVSSGDSERVAFDGEWDRSGRYLVKQDQPLPLTIVALGIVADVEEDS